MSSITNEPMQRRDVTNSGVAWVFCARGLNMNSAPPCSKGLAALAQVSYIHLITLILCFLHTVGYHT